MIRSVSPTEAQSRILRYLPGRLVVAWAVLGAAAGVALMYVPFVYEARLSDWPKSSKSPPEGRVRVLGKVVCDAKSQGEPPKMVNWWHRRVAACLAALGGLGGALVGWREQYRLRRSGSARPSGGRFSLAVTIAVFVLLVVAGVPGADEWTLLDHWRWRMRFAKELGASRLWTDLAGFSSREFVRLAIVSVAIGWAANVAAGARGVRLSFGRQPEEAADYGDDLVVPKSG